MCFSLTRLSIVVFLDAEASICFVNRSCFIDYDGEIDGIISILTLSLPSNEATFPYAS